MADVKGISNVASSVTEHIADGSRSRLQVLLLRRLLRLVELRKARWLTQEERRLVNHALYSTYWDCANLGDRAEASTILRLPLQVTHVE